MIKRFQLLKGQTVDKIDIDAWELQQPRPIDDLPCYTFTLIPIDCSEHVLIKILNTHADTIETIQPESL